MREILIIIAILGIVVFASGCVGDTTSEKTFSEMVLHLNILVTG